MKTLGKPFAKMLFYLLAGILFLWTGRLTYSLVSALLPDMQFAGLFALVLFDAGTLIWLMVFIHGAQGIGQRLVAITMTLVDLLGIGMVSAVELYLGGQTLLEVPPNIETLAVWVVVVYTFFNILAVVLFHLSDPAAATAITMQIERDKVQAAGLKSLEAKMEAIGDQLAEQLGEELKASVLNDLRSPNGAAKKLPIGDTQ